VKLQFSHWKTIVKIEITNTKSDHISSCIRNCFGCLNFFC